MKNLKCIGGVCDGVIWQVGDNLKSGDQVRVRDPKPVEYKLDTWDEDVQAYREGRTPDYLIIKYYSYRVCAIDGKTRNGNKQILLFLCPSDWHEWEAVTFKLGS